ncbi:NmrA family NAD(P)-binding protein [Rhizobium sp. Root1203]|uniref:NmrA family NAD(P)-binding protein n=1 Tax=Rhizobium sp. Root1203 TaxID=1736427 RepID=UPI001FCD66AA|nr:NmrA family NAD(P)-binding protein [Rhizobium sp. Root1203]
MLSSVSPPFVWIAFVQHEGLHITNDRLPILVSGATGQQGGSVATALLKAGWTVRALVRDPSSPKSIKLRNSGVELVEGSFADIDAVRVAMKDTHGVFSVLPTARRGSQFWDCYRESGCREWRRTSRLFLGG